MKQNRVAAEAGGDLAARLEPLLARVRKPSRYTGAELNAVRKEWGEVDLRIALVFPDLYEIGMSHHGLQILYQVLNRRPELLAERAYAPDTDLEALLRQEGLPLFSVESRRPLADFDLIGFTLPYELCSTNILTVLDLAGIPLRAADRGDGAPLVIGGGPCAFHPEPVADFFDAILLGDGEEAVAEIAETVRQARAEGVGRAAVVDRLSRIEGVYVPAFFTPRYDAAGRFAGIEPQRPGYERVRRRVLADLETAADHLPPLVPLNRIVHDRLGIEIARGCTRGCRFCQAGIIYRPVRERSPARVMELARRGIDEGGFEELALLSLSTGDYGCLPELLLELMDTFVDRKVSVSMPSMRVGTLTPEIMNQIKRVRKTGFTLAPEAGTDRLRRVINKGITEADLLAASRSAYALGWKLIKLYFMIGLPFESDEDVDAIAELAGKVLATAPPGKGQVNVSVSTFVPKPHTVFEREAQLGIDEAGARLERIKGRLHSKRLRLKWHDPRQSYLEGVLCRGDRRLSAVIEEAWRRGARFDAWNDFFDLDRWREAAAACRIELDPYLAARGDDEPLPWQHLDVGVSEEFFIRERQRALTGEYTPDCRVHGCQQCGLCDFKTIRPVVHRRAEGEPPAGKRRPPAATAGAGRFVYRLDYSRLDEARLVGHLEMIQMFFRLFRRLDLPLLYSQGFNPSPKVSFSPALPVGTESLAEYLFVELGEPLADPTATVAAMNRQLPPGFTIAALRLGSAQELSQPVESGYQITLAGGFPAGPLDRFWQEGHFSVSVKRKGRERQIDVEPLLRKLARNADGSLDLTLASSAGQAGIKPLELVAAVFKLDSEAAASVRIVKKWVRTVSPESKQ